MGMASTKNNFFKKEDFSLFSLYIINMKKTLKLLVHDNHNILSQLGRIATGLYNTANYQRQLAWEESGKIPNYCDQARSLKDNHLARLLPSQVAQQTLRELDHAYKSWYALKKQDDAAKPPRYRKKATPVSLWWTPAHFKIVSDTQIRFGVKNLDSTDKDFITVRVSKDSRYNLSDLKVNMINICWSKNKIYACCVCEFEDPSQKNFENAIALDLGICNMVASIDTTGHEEIVDGGQILAHKRYADKKNGELSRRLPKDQRSSRAIARIEQKCARQVRHKLHLITNRIVDQAEEKNACVVIGDLNGIRKNKRRKKTKNKETGKNQKKRTLRKQQAQGLNNWNYYTFTSFLEYKCKQKGIQLFKVSERNTSRKCPRCGLVKKSNRKSRGWYACKCGYRDNADITGCKNILTNFLVWWLESENVSANGGLSPQAVVATGAGRSIVKCGYHHALLC